MNLKFSGRGVAFLAHYKSSLDIRHYLLGVHLRPAPALVGGVVGLASNGHVLGIWHDPDGIVERPVTLRVTPELVRACGRRKPRGWRRRRSARMARPS